MLSPDTSQQKHSLCELFQSPSDSIYFMSRNYFTVKKQQGNKLQKAKKKINYLFIRQLFLRANLTNFVIY